MTNTADQLPSGVIWRQRPFPDANLLLLTGAEPAMVDSGFVTHANATSDWVRDHTDRLSLVVNTHWHSDHVGGNALLQRQGAGIAASAQDASALARRDPGCCLSEYLDQPVPRYTVDVPLTDGQTLTLGSLQWQVIATPGHTPGHISLFQPDERILVTGDTLSTYDVGWISAALDGPEVATVARASIQRLAELDPRIILPAHGPRPHDPAATLADAQRRVQRFVDDPDGTVWYAIRRIFGFALMIKDGIAGDQVEPYLHARSWMRDAARQLHTSVDDLATDLIRTMLERGAAEYRHGRLWATAEHTRANEG